MGWQAPDGVKRKNPARTMKASASPARGQKPSKKSPHPYQRFLSGERSKHGYGNQTDGYNVGRSRRKA